VYREETGSVGLREANPARQLVVKLEELGRVDGNSVYDVWKPSENFFFVEEVDYEKVCLEVSVVGHDESLFDQLCQSEACKNF
jgi:hypothetical protein